MKTKNIVVGVLFALIVSASGFASAGQGQGCDIVGMGASYAGDRWLTVTDSSGVEVKAYSRSRLLNGEYQGLCRVLDFLNGNGKTSCVAVAGAMSFPLNILFGNVYISGPGFMEQLTQAKRDCGVTHGTLRAKSVVISLVNDGLNAIVPTQQLIDDILNLGVSPHNIIVQAYPTKMPDFQREQETALEKHGPFWGAVINASGSVPNQEQYTALRNAHTQALKGYKGTQYLDFYWNVDMSGDHTFDGVHPRFILAKFYPPIFIPLQLKAAINIKMALH